MKPGAESDGTSTTSPSKIPYAPAVLMDHVPVDLPPITGSFNSWNLKVVVLLPSNVTTGMLEAWTTARSVIARIKA